MEEQKTVIDINAKTGIDTTAITTDSLVTSNDPQPRYNPEELKLQAEKQGYCILNVGEEVDFKGATFKIQQFNKNSIMFECPPNIFDLKIKLGEELKLKKGCFVVEHYGPKFMKVRRLPGQRILNQAVIDEYHKQEIKRLQKAK